MYRKTRLPESIRFLIQANFGNREIKQIWYFQGWGGIDFTLIIMLWVKDKKEKIARCCLKEVEKYWIGKERKYFIFQLDDPCRGETVKELEDGVVMNHLDSRFKHFSLLLWPCLFSSLPNGGSSSPGLVIIHYYYFYYYLVLFYFLFACFPVYQMVAHPALVLLL